MHENHDMKIATWNVNGIKARLDGVRDWLSHTRPDIACLQEIKSLDEAFPHEAFDDLGYNIITHGQKGFNGVAIFSRIPPEDVMTGLPGHGAGDLADGRPGARAGEAGANAATAPDIVTAPDIISGPDRQARYIEATICSDGTALRIACLYLPNGNPVGEGKFAYKLDWMERLLAHVERRLKLEEPFILLGDFNVIPAAIDARNLEKWRDDAVCDARVLALYRQLLHLGLTDALRAVSDADDLFTFWDYQGGAFRRDDGIRIDHILLSPRAADMLETAGIERAMRAEPRPSDHVPVWCELGVRARH